MTDILLCHAYFLKNDVIERRVMKPYPPLGILYLSAYLKRAGFGVEQLPLFLGREKRKDIAGARQPRARIAEFKAGKLKRGM